MVDAFALTKGYGHLDKVPYIALMLYIYWKLFSYLFFNRMAISKEDGTSPYFEYTPTIRDRICVIGGFFIFLFLLLGVGFLAYKLKN